MSLVRLRHDGQWWLNMVSGRLGGDRRLENFLMSWRVVLEFGGRT